MLFEALFDHRKEIGGRHENILSPNILVVGTVLSIDILQRFRNFSFQFDMFCIHKIVQVLRATIIRIDALVFCINDAFNDTIFDQFRLLNLCYSSRLNYFVICVVTKPVHCINFLFGEFTCARFLQGNHFAPSTHLVSLA